MFILLVILLLCIAMIIYFTSIDYLKTIRNISTEEAKSYIWNKVENLISHQKEFVPDGCLINDLIRELGPYNQLQLDNVPWCTGVYGRFKLPCIQIELVSKNGTSDFPSIEAVLLNCFDKNLTDKGYTGNSKILIQEYKAPTYIVNLVYATTKVNRVNYDKVEQMVTARAHMNAVRVISPVIDPDLENELQQINSL